MLIRWKLPDYCYQTKPPKKKNWDLYLYEIKLETREQKQVHICNVTHINIENFIEILKIL